MNIGRSAKMPGLGDVDSLARLRGARSRHENDGAVGLAGKKTLPFATNAKDRETSIVDEVREGEGARALPIAWCSFDHLIGVRTIRDTNGCELRRCRNTVQRAAVQI